MTEHLFDLLKKRVIEPYQEYAKLNILLSSETVITGFITLETYINREIFRSIPLRGTFLNVEDIRRELKIEPNIIFVTFRELFLLCELILGIGIQGESIINHSPSARRQFDVLIGNIMEIVERTNHELFKCSEQEYIIVEKNKAASQAADIITEDSVALQTIEYNHYLLKGNLAKKKSILSSIGNYIEPILRSKKLSSNGYATLESDAGFLLNNFNIRHNNKAGKNAQDYIISINDPALEEWYDKAYNTMLMVIITDKQIDINIELKQLKANHIWKT